MKLFLKDKFIGTLIIINCLVTFTLCFDFDLFHFPLLICDKLLTILFLCEIFYKIHVFEKDFFKSIWNNFDFIVVLISSIPLFLLILDINYFNNLDNLLLLRVFRLFKLFRIMRKIPHIDKIYSDLKKAIGVTYGIVILGFVILFIIGILLCSIFKNYDPVNFGDPIVSIYTVFRLFSTEGWYEIPDAMSENTSYLIATMIRISFSLIVLFGMFILGFVISSITDELATDNNDDLIKKTKELEEKIDNLTCKIDFLIKNKDSGN